MLLARWLARSRQMSVGILGTVLLWSNQVCRKVNHELAGLCLMGRTQTTGPHQWRHRAGSVLGQLDLLFCRVDAGHHWQARQMSVELCEVRADYLLRLRVLLRHLLSIKFLFPRD